MKAILGAIVLAGLLTAASARAQDVKGAEAKAPDGVPKNLLDHGDALLERVTAAVKGSRKRLGVLVVGSGSSGLASAGSASDAYPARLEAVLRKKLPGVVVTVTANLQPRRTAEEMAETLQALVAEHKPELLIWQTGTVDAIRTIHTDDFRSAVDEGIGTVKAAGVDALLINLQYNPRVATILAVSQYLDAMRAVAHLRNVPLFDRYAIMQNWNESGEFDLSNSSSSFALAKAVHDCLGKALAQLVMTAARLDQDDARTQR
jgi:hypothetical protein